MEWPAFRLSLEVLQAQAEEANGTTNPRVVWHRTRLPEDRGEGWGDYGVSIARVPTERQGHWSHSDVTVGHGSGDLRLGVEREPRNDRTVRLRGRLDPAAFASVLRHERRSLCPPLEVQLREDRADVVLDGLVRQEYVGCDLLVRLALGDEHEDPPFL